MSTLLLLAASLAVEPELVLTRVADSAPLRALRLDRGAPSIAEATYLSAAAGRVETGLVAVEGHKAKKAWGVAVVDAPIGRLWAAINDDHGKVKWTKLDYAEVLEGGLCGSPRRVFQYLPVPLISDRWWVATMRTNARLDAQSGGRMREQTWATDGDFTLPTPTSQEWGAKGMHVESTQGAWLLLDLDGAHTLIEYYTFADPGGSVPAGLASSLAANGIEDTVAAMTGLAKQGPSCRIVDPLTP